MVESRDRVNACEEKRGDEERVSAREKHKDGDLHDHVGLLADRAFRFAPVKKILLQDYSLASHWSCSHVGYASCVAYGYTPTQKKPFEELDKELCEPRIRAYMEEQVGFSDSVTIR